MDQQTPKDKLVNSKIIQFDFGQNWKEFSQIALNPNKVQRAKDEFLDLIDKRDLKNKSFLDIGFGQGLTLLSAKSMGVNAVGCDINQKCADVLQTNQQRYFPDIQETIPTVVGSILENSTVEKIKQVNPKYELFDIVHSWGVLHHTGDMQLAIRNAASLVKDNGLFILAIYNKHWSSIPWKIIKYCYCISPKFIQYLLIKAFVPIIWAAKAIVTGESPKKQERGMDFYYNVVDWVGGYPYEYASIQEIESMLKPLGFKMIKSVDAKVPTGCNEFIFQKVKL